MATLSELDVQNVRHLLTGYEISHCKMTEYASQAKDQSVKQFFGKAAQSAMENKKELLKLL